jgi:hypothetical protein
MTNGPQTAVPLVYTPARALQVFPLAHADWTAVKKRVARMKEPFKLYEAIGGMFGGLGLVAGMSSTKAL